MYKISNGGKYASVAIIILSLSLITQFDKSHGR